MRWRAACKMVMQSSHTDQTNRQRNPPRYDRTLLWLILGLLALGLVMVTSAAMPLGQRLCADPLLFAKRALSYSSLALLLSLVTLQIPMRIWQQLGVPMLLISMLLLLLVLIVGNAANGAARWITIGPLHLQPAELTKLSLFCYLSGYLVRKAEGVRSNFWDFCKPLTVMLLLALLLLAQPDLGTVVVLFVTCLLLLFLAGACIWQLLAIVASGAAAVGLLIVIEPYRVRRITAFFNPWKDPYGSGYQLTQSLMAFGRGDYFGQGLGNGLQKLDYLPAAHTDFIFAVLAEELGYCGVVFILLLFSLLIGRALTIGKRALKFEQRFCGFLACAIGVWLGLQTIINMGTAVGLLPTKGLTLPLLSYGGSNLLVAITAMAMLLRIDFETRAAQEQAYARESAREQ